MLVKLTSLYQHEKEQNHLLLFSTKYKLVKLFDSIITYCITKNITTSKYITIYYRNYNYEPNILLTDMLLSSISIVKWYHKCQGVCRSGGLIGFVS